MMKLIKNVSLASGKSFKTVNVLFDENIELVSTSPIEADNITEEYDFKGCIIIPGAVDMHTHILTGNENDAKILMNASKLALSGGYTTLADLSYLTAKPVFRLKDIEYYESLIKQNSFCDIALWGNCDFSEYPYHLDNMNEIWGAGVVGFVIMHPSPNSAIDDMSYDDIMDLFDTIYDTDISFSFQGFEETAPTEMTDSKSVFIDKRLASIRKILRRLQDNPLHYIGIFDRESVEILNVAFRRSDLTYAFPIQELMAILQKFKSTGYAKDDSTGEFVKLLFDSMKNGKLYAISTEAGNLVPMETSTHNHAYSGYTNNLLKWTVPWVFSELWKTHRVTIQSCIRMLSENPAKRLGLFPVKGSIQKGSHADIVIIDPSTGVQSDLLDENGNKQELSCSIKATFLRGNLVTSPKPKQTPQGRLIKRTGTTRRKSSSTCWS